METLEITDEYFMKVKRLVENSENKFSALRLLHADVLVRELSPPDKIGSIILPPMAHPLKWGMVIQVGPKCVHVETGDIVHYPGMWSQDVSKWAGEGVYQITEENILGIGLGTIEWARTRKKDAEPSQRQVDSSL